MSLTSLLRKEAAKLGLTIREKIGNGAMSEGVFLSDRLDTGEKVALKVTAMGPLDLSVHIFPKPKLIPVYIGYQDEEPLPNDLCQPAQISVINEDTSDLARRGRHQVHVFDSITAEDHDLEYRLRQSVASRECIRILEEKEKDQGTNLVVRYKGDQFFTGEGFLYHALQMEHLEQLGLDQLMPDAVELNRKLSPQSVYNIAAQLCRLLQLTEESRIVHLDLKPGNIAVNPYDTSVKVLDFDLAVLLDGKCHPDNPEDVGHLIRKFSLKEDRLAGTP
ncbi:MAG TPA: hypothetical protein VJG49_02510, partial [Candidatus Nanoarchaeia archaeon]|nr:hypothetical protein [Candidatus Nanoarchaeia archaeon]